MPLARGSFGPQLCVSSTQARNLETPALPLLGHAGIQIQDDSGAWLRPFLHGDKLHAIAALSAPAPENAHAWAASNGARRRIDYVASVEPLARVLDLRAVVRDLHTLRGKSD